MKTAMFVAAVVLVSAVMGGVLVTCRSKDKPNFSFTAQDCPGGICVYIAPKYYQKRSLEEK